MKGLRYVCQERGPETETGGWRGDIQSKNWGNSVPDRGNSKDEGKWLRWGLRDRESPDQAEPEGQEQDFVF